MNQIHRYTPKNTLSPIPTATFYADVGVTPSTGGVSITGWASKDGVTGLTCLNVPPENPVYRNSLGGLSPCVDFVQANSDRMFSLDTDNAISGLTEGTVVVYCNTNTISDNLGTLLSGRNGSGVREFFLRTTTGAGDFGLSVTTNGSDYRHIVAPQPVFETAVVIILSRAADGTTALYYDGVVQTITTNTFNVGEFIPAINFLGMGDRILSNTPTWSNSQQWDGQISAMEWYGVPVTATQAQSITTRLQNRF